MAGLDGLVALLSGGLHGVDDELEQRRREALIQRQQDRADAAETRQQSRDDDLDAERKREGRRKAQADIIGLRERGFDEVQPETPDDWQAAHGADPAGSLPPGAVSLDDFDGARHSYVYNHEHDPAYVRSIDEATARATADKAKRDELTSARAAAYRLSHGKGQPGDDGAADPDALAKYENILADNGRGDEAVAIRKALELLAQDRFDHHVNVDDPMREDLARQRAAGGRVAKRTSRQNDAYSLSMDPKVLTSQADQNTFGTIVGQLTAAGMDAETARVEALTRMHKMTGGGRPKASSSALADSILAAALGGKPAPAATPAPQPAASAPRSPAAARSPVPATPGPVPAAPGRSGAPSAPSASRGPASAPATTPATKPAPAPARRVITADQAEWLRVKRKWTQAKIDSTYTTR